MVDQEFKSDTRLFKGIYNLIIFLLLILIIYLTNFYSFILFHTIAELFSIVIAFGIFVIGWNTRKNMESSLFLILGVSLLFVGAIDLLHTLSYKGMNIFIEFDANLPTQLWIAGRYLQAISFLFAFYYMEKEINPNKLMIGYIGITAFLILTIFYGVFPVCFIEGSGLTPFKIISEYLIIFILAVSLHYLYVHQKFFNKRMYKLIFISIVATMFAELAFTFYIGVYDLSNLLGHIFKIISFYLIYLAILQKGLEDPVGMIYTKLERAYSEADQIFNASLPLRLVDTDCKIIRMNDTFSKAFGVKPTEIIGERCFDVMNHKHCNTEICAMKQIDKGTKVVEYEIQYKTSKGEDLTFIVNTVPYRSEKGEFLGIIQNYMDITVRKRIEDQQKKAETEIKNLAKFPSENPNPVIRIDSNKILYTNSIGQLLFNIEAGSKIPENLTKAVEETFRTQATNQFELELNNKTYSFTITPIPEENYLNIYGLNITIRKNAEKRLRTLISTVSHELRTPISVLMMSYEMLKDRRGTFKPGIEEKLMETAGRNISLLKELAEDILMISQIDEQKIALAYQDYNPSEIIRDIITVLDPILNDKNIRFNLNLNEELTLKGDHRRIEQIFRIVLDNAIKFSKENSIIDIEMIKNYKGKYNPEDLDGILIKFRDYGVGIREEELPNIFERFYRGSNVLDAPGTGLGLSIAQDLIKLHGGYISVESELGEGTCVCLFFPRSNKT